MINIYKKFNQTLNTKPINMRLGNSNGNNRGKRYFVRGRDDQQQDILYAEEAEQFAKWFAVNHISTKNQLIGKQAYDDDVYHETYIRIYEIILFTRRHIEDYASYFHRAYYTNYIQGLTKENRYCELYPNYDTEQEADDDDELHRNICRLQQDVMDYVWQNYDVREFEIFKMYVSLKPAVNYHGLAKMTNLKYHAVQRIISCIMQDVKSNSAFFVRRRQWARA